MFVFISPFWFSISLVNSFLSLLYFYHMSASPVPFPCLLCTLAGMSDDGWPRKPLRECKVRAMRAAGLGLAHLACRGVFQYLWTCLSIYLCQLWLKGLRFRQIRQWRLVNALRITNRSLKSFHLTLARIYLHSN